MGRKLFGKRGAASGGVRARRVACLLAGLIAASTFASARADQKSDEDAEKNAAPTALIAVAANFKEPAEALKAMFHETSGETIAYSFGSTGALYAQITQGAPFDAYLAADQDRPAKAVETELTAGEPFTYAIGGLAVYSGDPNASPGPEALKTIDLLIIANPATAPYGAASRQVLERLGLWESVEPKLALAQNVGGAFSAVESGAVAMGFVALSAIRSRKDFVQGAYWAPPQALYELLRQDAVLLTNGADNETAKAFLDFLRTPEAQALIKEFGYRIE